ncbi:MAG TPA: hypothetical protein VGL99_05725, partial [Chloroflexota bacterium]
ALLTPVLRNAWGGAGGAVRMTASATFFVPQLTPVPATIVPSTPLPTPSSTALPATTTPTVVPATSTPTVTPTPTATPNPIVHCTFTVPPLDNNRGYLVWIRTNARGTITATWTMQPGDQNNVELDIYDVYPVRLVASDRANANGISVTSPAVDPEWYAIYFYNRGNELRNPTTGTLDFMGTATDCPG